MTNVCRKSLQYCGLRNCGIIEREDFMDNYIIMWLVIIAASITAELLTFGLTTIWCAISGFIALLISAMGGSLLTQIVVFILLTAIQLILLKPIFSKLLSFDKTNTNFSTIVGEKANVIEKIDNLENTGRVSIRGLDWKAKSYDDSIISQGNKVEIIDIKGATLIVRQLSK